MKKNKKEVERKTSKFAIVSLVLGVIGFLMILIVVKLYSLGNPSSLGGGNKYSCMYFSDCTGNVKDSFTCKNNVFFIECEVTSPKKLKDKIEYLRENIPPGDSIIASYAPDPVPKPDVEYSRYPDSSDLINNKITSVTCSAKHTLPKQSKNAFLIEENDIVWCAYIGQTD